MHPAAQYRATTSVVQVPIPRAGDGGVGSDRIRDLELVHMIAELLIALSGRPAGSVDITPLEVSK
ncbi:transcription-repair coupling factor [Mycobacteroides abscessus subsp. abscessus]|nr:transcription-repair coupling factor [Mycobacteroides abscessus subsp. abscessus]